MAFQISKKSTGRGSGPKNMTPLTPQERIDRVMHNGGKIKESYKKLYDDDIAAMVRARAKGGKIKRVMSPIPERLKREAVEEVRSTSLTKRPRNLPWYAIAYMFLNRNNTPGETSSPQSDPVIMEQYACPTIPRIAGGRLIPHKIKIDAGVPHKMLLQAKNNFGIKTFKTMHTTGFDDNMDMLYSQAGINRKGIYAPWLRSMGGTSYGTSERSIAYDQFGTVTMGMIREFIFEYAMPNHIRNFLTDPITGVNTGDMDLLFPIWEATSIHSIRNRMEYTPIDLSIYVCRCRSQTNYAPWAVIWNDWSVTGSTNDSNYCPTVGDNEEFYNFPVVQDIASQNSPSTGLQVDQPFNIETSCQLGITPQMSPMFNKLWEVCDVIKDRVMPDDILELHFEKTFKYCHSLRKMETYFTNELQTLNGYVPGDYEIMIFYSGAPGSCVGNMADTTLNVDALKSRISKTVSHSLRYAWKSAAPKDPTRTDKPEELFNDGWITANKRTIVTDRRTARFDEGYEAIVTTDQLRETGGGI